MFQTVPQAVVPMPAMEPKLRAVVPQPGTMPSQQFGQGKAPLDHFTRKFCHLMASRYFLMASRYFLMASRYFHKIKCATCYVSAEFHFEIISVLKAKRVLIQQQYLVPSRRHINLTEKWNFLECAFLS
jgi:hypothetical protein